MTKQKAQQELRKEAEEMLANIPQSQYLDIGKIDKEQLEDYAVCRKLSIKEIRKHLTSTLLEK